jgi:hypothetical protein
VVPHSDQPDVVRMWWMSLGLAGVVIGVVAALLGQIIAAARSIDQRADGIWTVGKQIAGNTASIWMLGKTNEHLAKMLGAAQSIDRTAGSIHATLRALADTNGKAG